MFLSGGSTPRPGEISHAHFGVLFLDELTEFSRSALEQLREPLETGNVNIARASQSTQFPADFMLIAACNPCKCGYLGDGTERCQCSANSIERYRAKLSGPLLDRIDMHVHLARVDLQTLQSKDSNCESSAMVRERVTSVRARQLSTRSRLNCDLSGKELEDYCPLMPEQIGFLNQVSEKLNLSARAYHRILRLARTIADIAGEQDIGNQHLSEAVGYRSLDRNAW